MNRIFDSLPVEAVCPVCHTADDGKCILVPIPGTEEDGIVQATPIHLDCAGIVATNYAQSLGIIPVDRLEPSDG